ncbi:NADPH-dependent 2,4-dienoyl-CoA reductase [Bradyrhizobium sp. AZCC 2289]|uniref:NADPH-dependent 2,4-dienoyl-CoA reductase n=1 Tax=Bradyrhizobium sp. AZCC 2289 TaxID=3117026 RepID=UPI002FF09207
MSKDQYALLLSPITIGSHVLRNRVVMGSIHTRLENEPDPVPRLSAFYSERARGGVALVITGGTSPNFEGRVEEGAQVLDSEEKLGEHAPIVEAVHQAGAKIILQVLHTGIYAKHPQIVGPCAKSSPINHRIPREMTTDEVERTIDDFVNCALLARKAGYDGIELMGSEGYLITQFTAARTNTRADMWGGCFENRIRFPVEIVRRTRERLGPDFLIVYRISAIDLVEGGLTGGEVDLLARAVENAGIDALNTGVGWHESVVPTIATSVPRAAFAFASARLKRVVSVPVIASNRINMPAVGEEILANGQADLVSMARPLLADPDFVIKAATGRTDEINTCIACNQACLDHIFTERLATCLVNPKACHETEFLRRPPQVKRRIAVIGSGPAGMACSAAAAERGHHVVLFEASDDIGGQLNLARRIPGKEQEFSELIRYFRKQLEKSGVDIRLGTSVKANSLIEGGYDCVVMATGIKPRMPEIEGAEHPKVVGYVDVISGRADVGERVAIIGTGGIGHDIAELLTAPKKGSLTEAEFFETWGVDPSISTPGGLRKPVKEEPTRKVTMLQRSDVKVGARLGKSTGWIHRAKLNKRGVAVMTGCTYHMIDDEGLHYSINGEPRLLPVDTIVMCAGQDPEQGLFQPLLRASVAVSLIGGARYASELDAKRAIDEGTRLAYRL